MFKSTAAFQVAEGSEESEVLHVSVPSPWGWPFCIKPTPPRAKMSCQRLQALLQASIHACFVWQTWSFGREKNQKSFRGY